MNRRTISFCLALFTAPLTQADNTLKAFPEAEPGMHRHVLQLPARPDEADLRVELQVGKTAQTDPHNRYFFAGRIEAQNIPGWGYTRYVVAQLGPMAGTLMAVDPAAPRVARFVALGSEPLLIRYNSRLPLVVYVPQEAEVRYRLWSAPADYQPLHAE